MPGHVARCTRRTRRTLHVLASEHHPLPLVAPGPRQQTPPYVVARTYTRAPRARLAAACSWTQLTGQRLVVLDGTAAARAAPQSSRHLRSGRAQRAAGEALPQAAAGAGASAGPQHTRRPARGAPPGCQSQEASRAAPPTGASRSPLPPPAPPATPLSSICASDDLLEATNRSTCHVPSTFSPCHPPQHTHPPHTPPGESSLPDRSRVVIIRRRRWRRALCPGPGPGVSRRTSG